MKMKKILIVSLSVCGAILFLVCSWLNWKAADTDDYCYANSGEGELMQITGLSELEILERDEHTLAVTYFFKGVMEEETVYGILTMKGSLLHKGWKVLDPAMRKESELYRGTDLHREHGSHSYWTAGVRYEYVPKIHGLGEAATMNVLQYIVWFTFAWQFYWIPLMGLVLYGVHRLLERRKRISA